jgi:hypothetical protein
MQSGRHPIEPPPDLDPALAQFIKRARQVYGRHLRRWRRCGAAAYGPAAARIWRRLTARAIQRAAGIT